MAEVHVIGEIESGYDFPDCRLFCKWNIQTGGGWRVIEGEVEGQTQTDLPEYDEVAYFSHPIDVHFTTKTMQGWPKFNIQVWHYDEFGRQELYGYGSTFVPVSPGQHEITCHTWRPKGGFRDEMMQRFIGGGLQLNNFNETFRFGEHAKLRTVTMGSVKLRISIITRHFDRFGILC